MVAAVGPWRGRLGREQSNVAQYVDQFLEVEDVYRLGLLQDAHEAGDHLIFIGEVLELDVQDGGTPLVFHGGGYRLLEPPLGA